MGSDISLFLNLHFSDDIWCEVSFHMLVCHPSIFFGQVSVKIWPIFKSSCFFSYYWVLRVLCIFWITDVSLINIFSQWMVLISLTWHCLSQSRNFIFNEVQLINSLLDDAFDALSKKSLHINSRISLKSISTK